MSRLEGVPHDAAENPSLLHPSFLRRLERLDLQVRRLRSGERRGDHVGRGRGIGTLFREHREYVQGDDPRFLDWNAFLRLGELVVKEFHAEESPRVLLLVDCSYSMALNGSKRFTLARQVAAALGYVALLRHASVTCVGFPTRQGIEPFRGQKAAARLLAHLARMEPGGEANLLSSLRASVRPGRSHGLAVLISDFLEASEMDEALRFLTARGFLVEALQLESERDFDVPANGVVELVDAETGRRRKERIDAALAAQYRAAVRGHFLAVEKTCRRLSAGYHRIPQQMPVEEVVLWLLRQGAVFK